MERDEAAAQMREIQRIMARTTLYTLLPGTSAIIGGGLALLGSFVSWRWLGSLDFQALHARPVPQQVWFCVMWAVIAAAAIAQDVVLTVRASRQQRISPTERPARFAALSLTPSIVVALVLSARLLWDGHVLYVTPVWMMCYGTGVYAAGLFSVRLPRVLGATFVLMGALGLVFFAQYGVVLAALSFGLLHVVFGILVLARARRSEQ